MSFRQKVYEQYLQLILDKIGLFQNALNDLKESSANETKSTAGDKHETALAMLQIEQKNTSILLKEALDQKTSFEQLVATRNTITIEKGNLVKTSLGYFFISIALGKTTVEGVTVIAISPQSPLGQKLLGLKTGDTTQINRMEYVIEAIL